MHDAGVPEPEPRRVPRRASPLAWVLLLLSGCALPGSPEEPSGSGRASGLVLVTLDTTRPDHLGAYGSRRGLSPTFDSLAATGLLFESCDSSSPLTLPSHATLMTGLYPSAHGLRINGEGKLAAGVPTLATESARRGMATAAFVSSSVLSRRHGLDRGFAVYDDHFGASGERAGDQTVRLAADWLAAGHGPYFLWVHLYDPHAPYRPPEPWRALHAGAPYEGEIAWTDSLLARLLQAVRSRSARDAGEPVLCVVGDHGEGLGQHGEKEHGLFLYQSTLSVPFLLVGPGVAPERRAEPVRTVDVFPTLAGLAGLARGEEGPGVDLLEDPTARPLGGRGAYAETLMPLADYGWSPLYSWRQGHLKAMEGGYRSLFDLRTDAQEERDLLHPADAAGGRDTAARGDAAAGGAVLFAALARTRDGGARSFPAPAFEGQGHTATADLDRLRTLGYLGGTVSTPPGRGSGTPGVEDAGAPQARRPDPRDRASFHENVSLVLARYRDGDFDGADRLLEGLLIGEPNNPLLLDLAGSIQMARGRPAAAVAFHRRALEPHPDRAALRVHLAEALLAAGSADEAAAEARAVLAATGTPPGRAVWTLLRSLRALGRHEAARAEAARWLRLLPEDDPSRDAIEEELGVPGKTEKPPPP